MRRRYNEVCFGPACAAQSAQSTTRAAATHRNKKFSVQYSKRNVQRDSCIATTSYRKSRHPIERLGFLPRRYQRTQGACSCHRGAVPFQDPWLRGRIHRCRCLLRDIRLSDDEDHRDATRSLQVQLCAIRPGTCCSHRARPDRRRHDLACAGLCALTASRLRGFGPRSHGRHPFL